MSSAVADLEAGLQAMLQLKPPGVSGSRIQSITALCMANVQSESVLIQKLFTHFKKAPATHKLGVLYVVDSVTRKWTEQAKMAGQPIDNSAQDGTFAAGVNRVKELLPVLMNDIIPSAPEDQKEKIRKLVDIWEKGQTFPLHMLAEFKKMLIPSAQNQSTTTPPGSPPSDVQKALGLPSTAAANTPSILEALANLARQNAAAALPATATQPQAQAQQDNPYNIPMPHAQNNPAQHMAAINQTVPFQPTAAPAPVNVPAPAAAYPSQSQVPNSGAQNFASNQANPYAYAGAPPVVSPAALDPAVQQQFVLIKALADQGFTPDKIAGIMAAMGQGGVAPGAGGVPPQASQYLPQHQNQIQNQNTANAQPGWGPRPDESRDHNGYLDREAGRSPPGRYRQRSRSRSPARGWGARDSPTVQRHDDYGYDRERDSPGQARGDDRSGRGRGGRGNEYRQRSPPRRGGRSPSPPRHGYGGQKWVSHDATLKSGTIKVLSRTLFVGGVTMSEPELRRIFEKLGEVQTCIVNKEKRHAFVKMTTRADALHAKEMMEKNRIPDSSLRTRWGVGFGPRDCSDYQTGVSIIPISKLTDADRKWMLSAEYGGSGGKPIESGMVVEEPDIEIGAGVSSKAISRRMQTDRGGSNGPKSSRDRDEDDGSRYRRDDRRDDRRHDDRKGRDTGVSAPPSMPAIPPFQMAGFPFNLPSGMPMMPPGYTYPGQAPGQQPPAPGHRN
ncbi:uncharacterized protein BP5553_02592 [Venustampulla echinocandica]|uniref:Uncharacterized protein n=1 Tax=Venustampulla echinocandica TaxID=2656787 RepID=A0A370TRU2_9HELO|nr:uncharacterized protein BP5553_02592 [Venustampulla echinocandica]RDL38252.1 hypothetical protein BP5553_02592 [Venustampulla echinocandica]